MNSIQKNINDSLGIDKSQREEDILRIGAIIYQNVLIKLMEVMSEKDKDEFEKFLDNTEKPEEVFYFLEKKVPNFENIIKEEGEKFKNKDLKIMSQIGK